MGRTDDFRSLNEYLPLKQGLRHTNPYFLKNDFILNEYLPLKQGLRPVGSKHTAKVRNFSMSIFH